MTDNDEIKSFLQEMLEEYREKIEDDEELKDKLNDFDRNVSIKFEDDGNYHFSLSDGDVGDLKQGVHQNSDITITTTSEVLQAIVDGEISAMEAYAKKQVEVDASFLDIIKIKDMF